MYETRHIPAKHRLSAWLLAAVFALSLCVQPVWASPAERTVIPVGKAVGVKLFSDGVLVVGLAEGDTPARACGLREGDIITALDGCSVDSPEQVQSLLSAAAGKPMTLTVRRGSAALSLTAAAHQSPAGAWQLGAWIRDSMAGIGTMTFYDPESGIFGALGHGVTDADTGKLLPLDHGSIMDASVKAVKRGERAAPGERKGYFALTRDSGTLFANTESGIFGKLSGLSNTRF